MTLSMEPMGWAPKRRASWRLGTDDCSSAVFPSDTRLQELFDEQLPGRGTIRVLERGDNYLLIETPAGLTLSDRAQFIEAVWWGDMYFP